MSNSEPIETMRNKILRDAEEESQRIISEAEGTAAERIEQIKVDLKKKEVKEINDIKETIEQGNRERLAEERTEQHRRMQSYKSKIRDNVFNQALLRLREYCETIQYRETLKNIIIESGTALGGGNLIITVNKRNKNILDKEFTKNAAEQIRERTNSEVDLILDKQHLKSAGGAMVSKSDGSAKIDNSVEERLNRLKERVNRELDNILFR